MSGELAIRELCADCFELSGELTRDTVPALWQERADLQLYMAKSQGRNLVRLEPTAVSVVSNEEKRLLFDTFQMQDHE